MEIQSRLEQKMAFLLSAPNLLFQPTFSSFLSGLHHFLSGPCLPDGFTVGFCGFHPL